MGAAAVDLLRLAGSNHPRRDHAEAVAISTKPVRSSPRTPPRFPKSPSSGRTWDYRYCWLRDAYFVVQALNRIGATRTMEEFISFTLSIAAKPDEELRPLYSVVPTGSIEEWTAPHLQGYRGDGPVRIGNAAVDQVQHDAYGSVILAAMPMFFDRRLPRPGDEGLFHLLEVARQPGRGKSLRA